MNKAVRSLVLAFTLATAGFGAATANAQTATAGPPPQPATAYTQQVAPAANQVSQGDLDNFAYNVGVQTAYPLAGVGFSQGTLPSGQHVGIEYNLTGNQYTVRSAYNLDNPSDASAFQSEVTRAAGVQQSYVNTGSQVVYPQTYLYAPPIIAVSPFGFAGIYGWFPGYSPIFTPWYGFGYLGGRGYNGGFGHDGYRNDVRTTVINNRTTIINNGGQGFSRAGSFQGATAHGAPVAHVGATPQFNAQASFQHANVGAASTFRVAATPAFRAPAANNNVRMAAAAPRMAAAAPRAAAAAPRAAAPHAAAPAARGGGGRR